MPTFAERIASGLARHAAQTGSEVSYVRGDQRIEGVVGVKLQPRSDGEQASVLNAGTQVRYWSLPQLVLNGLPIEPEPEDIIEDGEDQFEVTSPDGFQPVWRPMDSGESRIRVHTRKITGVS